MQVDVRYKEPYGKLRTEDCGVPVSDVQISAQFDTFYNETHNEKYNRGRKATAAARLIFFPLTWESTSLQMISNQCKQIYNAFINCYKRTPSHVSAYVKGKWAHFPACRIMYCSVCHCVKTKHMENCTTVVHMCNTNKTSPNSKEKKQTILSLPLL